MIRRGNIMPKQLFNLAASTAIALGLAAAPALAQEWSDWDEDGDSALSEEEFDAGFGEIEVFDEWDENDDELVSEFEYSTGFENDYDAGGFAEADADADAQLTEDEFGDAVFGEYDQDDSGVLEEEEASVFGDDDWF